MTKRMMGLSLAALLSLGLVACGNGATVEDDMGGEPVTDVLDELDVDDPSSDL